DRQLALLLVVDALEGPVLREVIAEAEPPRERILRVDAVVQVAVAGQDGARGADAVAERPAGGGAELPLVLLRMRGSADERAHGCEGHQSTDHDASPCMSVGPPPSAGRTGLWLDDKLQWASLQATKTRTCGLRWSMS